MRSTKISSPYQYVFEFCSQAAMITEVPVQSLLLCSGEPLHDRLGAGGRSEARSPCPRLLQGRGNLSVIVLVIRSVDCFRAIFVGFVRVSFRFFGSMVMMHQTRSNHIKSYQI